MQRAFCFNINLIKAEVQVIGDDVNMIFNVSKKNIKGLINAFENG